jgi:PAS domain S-box-containing protein
MTPPALPPQRVSIRRKLLVGFGVVLLMLAVIAFITWRSTRGFLATAELVTRSRETLQTGERALRHLMEMESDRRGFLITGNDDHLRDYERAQVALVQDFDTLNALIAAAPEQRLRIAEMKRLILQGIALQHAEIDARRTADARETASLFAKGASDEVTSKIRVIMQDVENEERRVLAERAQLTKRVGAATFRVIIVGSVLTFVALVAAGTMILRDVAARRRAEEALADQHNLLSSIIDTIPDQICLKDVKGRYVMDNKAHRSYLRLTEPDSIEGKTVYDFFPEELAVRYDRDDQEVLETGQPLRNREEPGVAVTTRDMWLSTTRVPLREPDGRILGLVCVSADISERKEAEEKLQRFAGQLERSNAELQNFASVASHDLQEPLRKIRAFGDRLKAKCSEGLGELGRDYLERMQSAATRMQTLIHDLLKLSRVTSRAQPFEKCDLGELVREVLSDLEVMIEQKKARIEVGPLPVIDGDPVQLRQLFQNLISNAVKFHKPTAKPEVVISAKTGLANDHSIRGVAGGEEICEIQVRDDGIGFDERFVEQVFVVFQRLHSRSEFEGTGIGLAICRKITDRHGGTIVAKSTEGEGATFIVTLPVRQPSNEADER